MQRLDLRLMSGWRQGVWLLGVSLLWVSYAEGSPAIRGLAVAVLFVLFSPLGRRARPYGARVYKIRKGCLQAINTSTGGYAKWAARHRRAMELLSVPASMEALRQALLGSLIDPLREGPPPKLVETATSRRHAIERLAAAMRTSNPPEATRAFLSDAKTWWAAANQRLAELSQESEQFMSAAMAELEGLRPPRSLRSAHRNLGVGLRDEYIAVATFYRAVLNLDAKAAVTAHDEIALARTKIRTATTSIFTTAFGTQTPPAPRQSETRITRTSPPIT